jgi:cytochrome c-type protein NapB
MCRKSGESVMKNSDQKVGKLLIGFAGVCLVAVTFIVLSAFNYEPDIPDVSPVEEASLSFDQQGASIFENYDAISEHYLAGMATDRTLSEYYSRRQYSGSPPLIPHPVVETFDERVKCLSCHAKGGFTEALKRSTPVTPHPEHTSCRQCHVRPETDELFRETVWLSVQSPRLGRSHLPGSPPPTPHELQMRGNCIACHVGPGAVAVIRVEHPMRGNCRQCHVPDNPIKPFRRDL